MKSLITSGLAYFSSSFFPDFACQSCMCNKSQRLPFGESTLESRGPLDLIYIDVWGPAPVQSIYGFLYYVIFIYHFTKYVWLYLLRLKSDVFTIFRQYKAVVEKKISRPIILVYSNGGEEYTILKNFLCQLGIQHLKPIPLTPLNIMVLSKDFINTLLILD